VSWVVQPQRPVEGQRWLRTGLLWFLCHSYAGVVDDCPWAGSLRQVMSGRLKPSPAKTDSDPSALSRSQKG